MQTAFISVVAFDAGLMAKLTIRTLNSPLCHAIGSQFFVVLLQ